MKIELDGTTALVTGSTQGIGFAIARGLAAAGARVIVNGRSTETTDAARARLLESLASDADFAALDDETQEARVVTLAADLATEAGAQAAVAAFPEVDVLVNNLGVFGSADALSIDDDEWRRYFETNVLSAVRLTRAYLPGMMQRGWGRVQYIASDSAIVTPVEMIHYGVSKTALLGVSRGFAKAAAGSGVTVNSVVAGPTHTGGVEEFVRELVGDDLPWEEAQHEFMLKHRPQSLIQRLIEPEEIANMVVYLSSRLASATTGGALRVDGGYVDAIVP
ncbi:SDR family NAD(P)-dependent oxidoreductase [Frigoribacterium sp. CFBP 8751]|uniref:SDR family NAD(P)-dependent oxidoreductase n=1 Tax=Frigoribacterium sp. CFBP 8751 TaxID=2775277 RepID=UPI001783A66D|nr:SDR family oxidoreductase [Frigoribacterium sp. CFBP 8751]MBD8537402.1 SDR family oxidoreductase [Frigoribacterium sp. CFBP 8751]